LTTTEIAEALREDAAGTPGPRGRGAEEDAAQLLSIRDLAKEFGVSARLKYVMMGKAVGFSLDEIREMLDLYDVGDRQVTQLRVAHDKFGERIARLQRQRDEIDRAIAELAHARKIIDGMLATRERGAERV
jgi:MerR, DNA binding